MENEKPQLGNIKDQLFLISFIILGGGLIFIDSYFQVFGVKFQTLDFNAMYVIYKGMVMILNYPSMLIPYFISVILLIFEVIAIQKKFTRFLAFRIPIVYIILFIDLLIIFPLAKRAGIMQADMDLSNKTSTLPRIEQLIAKEDVIKPTDNYRLLLIDKDFIYIFNPSDDIKTETPIIERIPKSEVTKFTTQLK